jgi:menaquinol-cytochrome c reductase iron-sulfur subunit
MSAPETKPSETDVNTSHSSDGHHSSGDQNLAVRRSTAVQLLTALLSFVIVAVPSTLGGLFFLDPILRKRHGSAGGGVGAPGVPRKDEAGFIRLDVTADVIPVDGTPVAVKVNDDLEDAWNKFPDVPVGSIWLRRNPDGTIVAFNSICPHLGCSVDYRRSENDFYCPCHTSAFALDGRKTNNIPPRDMDGLEVSVRKAGKDDASGSELWVKYQKFRGTTAEKIPV